MDGYGDVMGRSGQEVVVGVASRRVHGCGATNQSLKLVHKCFSGMPRELWSARSEGGGG